MFRLQNSWVRKLLTRFVVRFGSKFGLPASRRPSSLNFRQFGLHWPCRAVKSRRALGLSRWVSLCCFNQKSFQRVEFVPTRLSMAVDNTKEVITLEVVIEIRPGRLSTYGLKQGVEIGYCLEERGRVGLVALFKVLKSIMAVFCNTNSIHNNL